ncbi:MAG TPA: TPM domain-containing protein [Gemmatimonadales bacterium]
MSLVPAALLAAALLVQGPTIPAPTGHVNDLAGVLSAEAEARMDAIARDVRAKSGGEIAVVTLRDLEGRDVSEVALAIGRQWGVGAAAEIGDATRNAGAVVLIVPKETSADGRGHCWVSTGRGTEGFLLDSDAGAICREAVPYFRNQDYGSGTLLVTTLVAREFAQEFGFALDTSLVSATPARTAQREPARRGFPFGLIFFFIFLFLMTRRGRRRGRGGFVPIILPGPGWGGGWGGGSGHGGGFGGGGFGGFGGGGGFSGGGGGSSW